jgi:hypothetical protein
MQIHILISANSISQDIGTGEWILMIDKSMITEEGLKGWGGWVSVMLRCNKMRIVYKSERKAVAGTNRIFISRFEIEYPSHWRTAPMTHFILAFFHSIFLPSLSLSLSYSHSISFNSHFSLTQFSTILSSHTFDEIIKFIHFLSPRWPEIP